MPGWQQEAGSGGKVSNASMSAGRKTENKSDGAAEPEAALPVNRVSRAVSAIAGRCVDHALLTIAGFAVLAALCAAFAAMQLKVDTDPSRMISNDLRFSLNYQDFAKQFPALDNTFVIIVDSEDPDQGQRVTADVAAHLRDRPGLFSNVFAPGTGAFFDTYGVLYLEEPAVRKLAGELKQMAPMLKIMAAKPNLAGLDGLFKDIVPVVQSGGAPGELAGFLERMSGAVDAETRGKPKPLDWSAAAGRKPTSGQTRWYVFVKPVLDYSTINAASKSIGEVRQLIGAIHQREPGAKVQLTGDAALNAEEFETVTKGAAIAGMVSFALVAITMLIGLPSLVLIVPAIALIVLGFLINAGFAALAVGYLNLISVAFAVLFIGLGVDYAVHVVLRFAEERAKGADGRVAAVSAVTRMASPLTLCTLTTSLAFLSFVPTDFVGMAQLGIIAAGGIVIAFVCSITLVPAILSRLPGAPEKFAQGLSGRFAAQLNRTDANGGHARKAAAVIVIVLALASLWLVPQARFDGDPVNLKDPAAASMVAYRDTIEREPGRVFAIQLLSEPGATVAEATARLKALPEVADVETIATFVPNDQPAKLAHLRALAKELPVQVAPARDLSEGDLSRHIKSLLSSASQMAGAGAAAQDIRAAAVRLETSLLEYVSEKGVSRGPAEALQAALTGGFPAFFANIQQLSGLDAVTPDNIAEGLRERYIASDGHWRLEVIPRGDMRDTANRGRFVEAVTAVYPDATGVPVDIYGSAGVVASAMGVASVMALGLVVLVVFPVLRRIRDVFLVLAPLLLAMALVVGYTVILEAPFNFANVIVLPLLLGLGIDSAIHYVMRAREDSFRTDVTSTSTPRAVLISAVTTMGSFGTLWLSPHRGTASMGELLTVSIIVTLLCTLVVLPQLLAWLRPKAVLNPIEQLVVAIMSDRREK